MSYRLLVFTYLLRCPEPAQAIRTFHLRGGKSYHSHPIYGIWCKYLAFLLDWELDTISAAHTGAYGFLILRAFLHTMQQGPHASMGYRGMRALFGKSGLN